MLRALGCDLNNFGDSSFITLSAKQKLFIIFGYGESHAEDSDFGFDCFEESLDD